MKNLVLHAALFAAAILAAPAYAKKPVKDPVVPAVPANPAVNASLSDVQLAGIAATSFAYALGVNPQGKETSSGFDDTLLGDWKTIGGFKDNAVLAQPNSLVDSPLQFSFSLDTGKTSGDWSVKNTDLLNSIQVDLVFAMHTGGGSGAWMFNDYKIDAGAKLDGEWMQTLLNPGGKAGAFSNVTFFSSAMALKPKLPPVEPPQQLPPELPKTPTDVPEPATLGTILLGLGMLTLMGRRRNKQR